MSFLKQFFKSLFSDSPDIEESQPSLEDTLSLLEQNSRPETSSAHVSEADEDVDDTPSATSASLSELLNTFKSPTWTSGASNQLKSNMQALKEVTMGPKEHNVEMRFGQIQKYLGVEECHETVRQDRWKGQVQCPKCHSKNIKKIEPEAEQSPHNFRYRCKACDNEFNDDSDTPLETGVPSLETWMQCWYLMSITSSISYIAAKLGMDFALAQEMVLILQRIFKAEEPLTHFKKHKDWNKEASRYEKIIKEEIMAKKDELLNAEKADAPKDTAENRRQRVRRRNPNTSR